MLQGTSRAWRTPQLALAGRRRGDLGQSRDPALRDRRLRRPAARGAPGDLGGDVPEARRATQPDDPEGMTDPAPPRRGGRPQEERTLRGPPLHELSATARQPGTRGRRGIPHHLWRRCWAPKSVARRAPRWRRSRSWRSLLSCASTTSWQVPPAAPDDEQYLRFATLFGSGFQPPADIPGCPRVATARCRTSSQWLTPATANWAIFCPAGTHRPPMDAGAVLRLVPLRTGGAVQYGETRFTNLARAYESPTRRPGARSMACA